MVTDTFRKQLFDPASDDPFLFLIKMTHPSWGADQLLVNNNEDIISRGETYLALPMNVKLPQDDGESVPQVQLEIDNVSIDLIDEIRSITTPIQVSLVGALASNPDIWEVELHELKISTISYDKEKITATLILDGFLSQTIPSEHYNPSNFPGLF